MGYLTSFHCRRVTVANFCDVLLHARCHFTFSPFSPFSPLLSSFFHLTFFFKFVVDICSVFPCLCACVCEYLFFYINYCTFFLFPPLFSSHFQSADLYTVCVSALSPKELLCVETSDLHSSGLCLLVCCFSFFSFFFSFLLTRFSFCLVALREQDGLPVGLG